MKVKSRHPVALLGAALVLAIGLLLPIQAAAHCDTLDGPVVADARIALAKGDVTPVLKWVGSAEEKEIRTAFATTMVVRELSPEAESFADMYFFETLVRIHRAGEGAPYTGVKAAGTIDPVVAKADNSLEQGSVDELVQAILTHSDTGIRERFAHALETKKHAAKSVAAGREYVEAYVAFVHYVEEIAQVVHATSHHAETPVQGSHQH